MSTLVLTAKQALENVHRFRGELKSEGGKALQGRLAYARAWYAHQDDAGEWCFGPSKFIGYKGMTTEEYLSEDDTRDGRRTEKQLSHWFTELAVSDPLHQELSDKLAAFLKEFGKEPSRKTRINIPSEY
jgi:hypothetical protein